MTINTKFSLGDEVYYITHNKIESGRVTKIYISVDEDKSQTEQYRVDGRGVQILYLDQMFVTKEDLIAVL